jgi:hypothetical protein
MNSNIPDSVIEHIEKTSKFIGGVETEMKHINTELGEVKAELKKKASKEDVDHLERKVCEHKLVMTDPAKPCPAAERAVKGHIDKVHPSQEEQIGRVVVGLVPWIKDNRKASALIAFISIALSYFGLDFVGVF